MRTASAVNEYKGMTHGEASGQIWGSGAKAGDRIAAGTYLSTYNCIVSGSHKATLLNSSGSNRGSVVMVDLNCNYPFATANAPGNSGQSEGRAAREQAEEQYAQQQAAAQAAQAAAGTGGGGFCGGGASPARWLCATSGIDR